MATTLGANLTPLRRGLLGAGRGAEGGAVAARIGFSLESGYRTAAFVICRKTHSGAVAAGDSRRVARLCRVRMARRLDSR